MYGEVLSKSCIFTEGMCDVFVCMYIYSVRGAWCTVQNRAISFQCSLLSLNDMFFSLKCIWYAHIVEYITCIYSTHWWYILCKNVWGTFSSIRLANPCTIHVPHVCILCIRMCECECECVLLCRYCCASAYMYSVHTTHTYTFKHKNKWAIWSNIGR